jgi:hypothetical protein
MSKQRTRREGSFWARLPDGRRLQVDIYVTEVDVGGLQATSYVWTEVSRRYESSMGPVNSIDGQLQLARDGTALTRE